MSVPSPDQPPTTLLAPQVALRLELHWEADAEKARQRPQRPGELMSDDLDASVLLFSAEHQLIETVWYRHPRSRSGAAELSGDERAGAAPSTPDPALPDSSPPDPGVQGGDEHVTVRFGQLGPAVWAVVFTVTNYSDEGLDHVQGARCRLVNAESDEVLIEADLSAQGQAHGLVVASVIRQAGGWRLRPHGTLVLAGRTYFDTLPTVQQLLRVETPA